MAAVSSTAYHGNPELSFKPRLRRLFPSNVNATSQRSVAMASIKKNQQNQPKQPLQPELHKFQQKQPKQPIFVLPNGLEVNKYDPSWEKKWFGAGIFYEATEDVELDVFKKLEKRKFLSNVEKAGLLSKAEGLGFTLSSIEKLGLFSKAEELGLLSLLEKVVSLSPSALASAALPVLTGAILCIVLIPDDSAELVAVQAVLAGVLGVGAVGLYVGSVVLEGLQETE